MSDTRRLAKAVAANSVGVVDPSLNYVCQCLEGFVTIPDDPYHCAETASPTQQPSVPPSNVPTPVVPTPPPAPGAACVDNLEWRSTYNVGWSCLEYATFLREEGFTEAIIATTCNSTKGRMPL